MSIRSNESASSQASSKSSVKSRRSQATQNKTQKTEIMNWVKDVNAANHHSPVDGAAGGNLLQQTQNTALVTGTLPDDPPIPPGPTQPPDGGLPRPPDIGFPRPPDTYHPRPTLDPRAPSYRPPVVHETASTHSTGENLILENILVAQMLPQSKIEPFHGDVTKYPSFKSTFQYKVERILTDPTERFNQLMNHLRDFPARLVEGYPLQGIWQLGSLLMGDMAHHLCFTGPTWTNFRVGRR